MSVPTKQSGKSSELCLAAVSDDELFELRQVLGPAGDLPVPTGSRLLRR